MVSDELASCCRDRLTVSLLELEWGLQAHVAGRSTKSMWVCGTAAWLVYHGTRSRFCTAMTLVANLQVAGRGGWGGQPQDVACHSKGTGATGSTDKVYWDYETGSYCCLDFGNV